MVVNAGNKFKDLDHMKKIQESFPKDGVTIKYIENRSLVALQGPQSANILQSILKDQIDLKKV